MVTQIYNVKDFETAFIKIYGLSVFNDCFKQKVTTEKGIKQTLLQYKNCIITMKKNFYSSKNKKATRFVLITLERYYNSDLFKHQFHLSNGNKWHIEHIYPKKWYPVYEKELGNLTLISRELNTDSKNYSDKSFYSKVKFLRQNSAQYPAKYLEYNFYINKIFRECDICFNPINRRKMMLENFGKIFDEMDSYFEKVLNIKWWR